MKNSKMISVLVVLVIILIGGIVYYFQNKGQSVQSSNTTSIQSTQSGPLTVSNMTGSIGAHSAIPYPGAAAAYPVSFSLTLTAVGQNIYLAKSYPPAIAITDSGFGSHTSVSFVDMLCGVSAKDTDDAYMIPAGTSRNCSVIEAISGANSSSGLKSFSLSKINYGTDPSNLTAFSATQGLSSFVVQDTI